MTEECPNCRQLTNTSFSRLVKDSCGHTKCRMCLLYEEHGCKTCNNEHRIQNIGNYDCPSSFAQDSSNNTTNVKDAETNEDIILPLELVINKDAKQKLGYGNYSSADYISTVESYSEDISLNTRKELYESSDINNGNEADHQQYIPKTESGELNSISHSHVNSNTDCLNTTQSSYSKDNIVKDGNSKLNVYENENKKLQNKPLKHIDRTHISVVPGNPERYKCNVCCKVFRNKKGKCYHDACITGIRPYQCKLCDRSFVKRSHYEYHERVHTGYRPFKCNICDKAFPQQNKLNRHMYSHNKEKQFACTKCNKAYSKRDDLNTHMALHNSTATYPCKSCGKTFRILTNLKRHMRTHTNDRPHVCDQCGKSFKDKSLLIRHKRTHGKERPYSCAHCNRVFLSKSELRRHLTVHSDERPFSCEYCQTVFRRKDNLKRHIRHHHSEDSADAMKEQSTVKDKSIKLEKLKQSNPKQKQKPKKTQRSSSNILPKSPSKVSVVYISTRDQINSRLDSMGNITPVIRTTSEVSNAVPVINGPISIKESEKTIGLRKKTFTYTEPIPLAQAVIINRQIEEKLYSQNASNRNCFFRNYSNCTDKSYSTATYGSCTSFSIKNTIIRSELYENSSDEVSASQNSITCQSDESNEFPRNRCESENDYRTDNIDPQNKSNDKQLTNNEMIESSTKNQLNDIKHNSSTPIEVFQSSPNKQEQTIYVPTIKKHIMQQFELDTIKDFSLMNSNNSNMKVHLHEDLSQKTHWRRRTAEILKPNN